MYEWCKLRYFVHNLGKITGELKSVSLKPVIYETEIDVGVILQRKFLSYLRFMFRKKNQRRRTVYPASWSVTTGHVSSNTYHVVRQQYRNITCPLSVQCNVSATVGHGPSRCEGFHGDHEMPELMQYNPFYSGAAEVLNCTYVALMLVLKRSCTKIRFILFC